MQNQFIQLGHPLRQISGKRDKTDQGYLVLFGELFNRGYANGLVEEAQKNNFKIIKSTVGRRDAQQNIRALEENEKPTDAYHFINVPLEAGFDMEKDDLTGTSPVDDLKDLGLKSWSDFRWSEGKLQRCLEKGRARFRHQVRTYVAELNQVLPEKNAQVLFAHLMAGGVPRAKIVMPLMNRVFKGTGERYMESESFWKSSIGELCSLNFNEVTAYTLDILIDETAELRKRITQSGGHVSYIAYGYHGTEIWIKDQFQWQSYSPYLQGWAKIELEKVSENWKKKNVTVSTYNCPEILTNSSSIFQGVEAPLYNLLKAFQKLFPDHGRTHQLLNECTSLLKKPQAMEDIFKSINDYYQDPEVLQTIKFAEWPSHSRRIQLEKLLQLSELVVDAHQDSKKLMTAILSEVVFRSCGWVMFHDSYQPAHSSQWIGHDLIASVEVGRT